MTTTTQGASGLADRYATALFELALADKALEKVESELGQLATMINDSNDLRRLIRSPVISRDDQRRGMTALMAKAGMGDLTTRFVGLVASHRRLFALSDMIVAYQRKLAAKRGETTAEVISANTLSETQLTAVTEALKKAIGRSVAVSATVDPQLLGGLVVKVGSRMIDDSLRTKLHRLRLAMKGIG